MSTETLSPLFEKWFETWIYKPQSMTKREKWVANAAFIAGSFDSLAREPIQCKELNRAAYEIADIFQPDIIDKMTELIEKGMPVARISQIASQSGGAPLMVGIIGMVAAHIKEQK